MPNSNSNDDDENTTMISNTSYINNDFNSDNQKLKETENILAKNEIFALIAMTSAVTFPTNFKSIEVQKHQIKFKTINSTKRIIEFNTNENEVRNVREEF